MKIVAIGNNGDEISAKATNDVYRCFPPSENRKEYSVTFTRIEDAACFLILKPDWGIRMDDGTPIKYRGIKIVRDE